MSFFDEINNSTVLCFLEHVFQSRDCEIVDEYAV